MASAGGLLALFDDIATLLDDVASMTKMALKQSVGIVGDDIAVGANQVAQIKARSEKERSIVRAVARGSLINKAFLSLGAVALNIYAPAVTTALLVAGGTYLCYEGVHKVLHSLKPHHEDHHLNAMKTPPTLEEVAKFEKEKIKDAIRTDVILSAEIIVLSLSMFSAASPLMQLAALGSVGVSMTALVYGLVYGVLSLDDKGVELMEEATTQSRLDKFKRGLGEKLLTAAPKVMHGLGIVGTAAMFLVGGGIMMHHMPDAIAPFMHHVAQVAEALPSVLGFVASHLLEASVGFAAGLAAVGGMKVLEKPLQVIKPFVAKAVSKIAAILPKKNEEASDIKQPAPQLETETSAASLSTKSIKQQLNESAVVVTPEPAVAVTKVRIPENPQMITKQRG